jgi:hypothetical protein
MRLLAMSALTVAALAGAADARPRLTGEAELAQMLQGRVAGAPVECITTYGSGNDMRVIDRTALVFGRGNTIYVNRTQDPRSVDDNDVLVIRKFGSGSQLCRTDIITTLDRGSRMYSGNVFLTRFVPYRRVR